MNINDTRYPAKWYAGRSPCENFVHEIATIVENRVTRSNRNTILHGIIKQKQLRKHQMYIMNAPTTVHRQSRTITIYTFLPPFFLRKSWNFCNINRRSTRPDNFVTDVKMLPDVPPCIARRAYVAIGSIIFARRVLQFTRHFTARCRPYTNDQGSLLHCVCLITAPLKYMILYFNIQRRPIWKYIFYAIQMSTLHRLNDPTILVNFARDKQNLDRVTKKIF